MLGQKIIGKSEFLGKISDLAGSHAGPQLCGCLICRVDQRLTLAPTRQVPGYLV